MSDERFTANFSRSEFACRCGCGFDTADWALVQGLQELRDITGQPVYVNSGCRCPAHNASIGGSPKSQHMRGRAADVVVENYNPAQVADIAERIPVFRRGGIGIYGSFVHLDTRRNGPARW